MKVHLQMCPFQKIVCSACGARFYRSDQDYHSSACTEAQIDCPLNCGKVFKRSELVPHFKQSLLDHSYTNLQSEVYLPPDHPSMVYAALLKQIKELKVQLEISKNPQLLNDPDGQPSSSLLGGAPPSPYAAGGLPPRLSPAAVSPGLQSPLTTAVDNSRGVASQLPLEHLQRYESCMSRLEQLRAGVQKAMQTIDMTPPNPSRETKDEMTATRSVLQRARETLAPEVEVVLREIEELSTYVDANGRKAPQSALLELSSQRSELNAAGKRLDSAFYDFETALYDRQWN